MSLRRAGLALLLSALSGSLTALDPIEFEDFDLMIHGSAEARWSRRTRHDPRIRRRDVLAEARLELDLEAESDAWLARLKPHFVADRIGSAHVDLDRGTGWIDLREAWIESLETGPLRLTAGRQVLTWGTGDLLFINDLFPKDWVAFVSGRNDTLIKAPSDALRVAGTPGGTDVIMVYTPRFDPDRTARGQRLTVFSPFLDGPTRPRAPLRSEVPDRAFTDDEWALRIKRLIDDVEIAVYGYDGFFKSPEGLDPRRGVLNHPRLSVLGASVRGPLLGGVANAEWGYYQSRDDRKGTDPFIPNSLWKGLLGYSHELWNEATLGIQYYVEQDQHWSRHLERLPPDAYRRQQTRETWTMRLSQALFDQTVQASLMVFHSPDDRDTHWRPRVSWKVTDAWELSAGANHFAGEDPHTRFGQFKRASNVFMAVKSWF